MPPTHVASVEPATSAVVLPDVSPAVVPLEPVGETQRPGAPLHVRAIFDEHFDYVWRVLRRLGVAEPDLDDAVQEVFLIVHRKLAGFEGRSRVTTWLFGICNNVASERRRATQRTREEPGDGAMDPIDPAATPEERYQGREAREKLDEVLDQLDADKRAVFVLYEIDELPVERIAEMVGVPVGTVYSRLRAARIEFDRALARMRARWAGISGRKP